MDKENRRSSTNRRKLLKAMGASSIASIGFSSLTGLSMASEDQAERKLTRLEGDEREKTLQDVRQTEEVERLIGVYKEESWTPDFNQAQIRLVERESGGSFRLAIVPFEQIGNKTPSNDNQAILIWKKQGSEVTVTGHQLIDDGNPTGSGRNVEEVKHEWADDGLVEQSHQSEIRSKDQVSAEDNLPGGGGGGDCIYLDTYCVDFNLSCIGLIVGALGLACGGGGLVGCLATALMEGGAYYTGDGCNVCDEYTTEAKTKPVCNCPSCY